MKTYDPYVNDAELDRLWRIAYAGIALAITLILVTVLFAIHLDRSACEHADGHYYRGLDGAWCELSGVTLPGPKYLSGL